MNDIDTYMCTYTKHRYMYNLKHMIVCASVNVCICAGDLYIYILYIYVYIIYIYNDHDSVLHQNQRHQKHTHK